MTKAVERTLPHNLDAERSVLGAVIVSFGRAMDSVADTLRPDDFFRDSHRHIYRAMQTMYARGALIDFVTLSDELNRAGRLDDAGGRAYVSTLADGIPASTNVPHYAALLRAHAAQRDVIIIANRIMHAAYAHKGDAAALIEQAERALLEVSLRAVPGDLVSPVEMVRNIRPVLEELVNARRPVTGIETGLATLDVYTRGLQPGNLILIAARPSMGKTTIVGQIGLHVSQTVPVAYFSAEMAQQEQMFRVISTLSAVDGHRLQCGQMSMFEQQRVGEALIEFEQNRQLYLDDSNPISPVQIRSRARRMKARVGLGLIIVDYLQLLEHPRADRHDLAIGQTAKLLKATGRELGVPVIALSQLSRAVEHRDGRRPTLADLRESGALEQDADLVLFLHRAPEEDKAGVKVDPPPNTELIIAKQRNGPKTSIELRWHAAEYRYEEIPEES